VFWRNGYQGASLSELTTAMGISKPSLYAAFGNKEQLYLSALQRYRQQYLDQHARALAAEPDLRKAMRDFLQSVARMLTAPELPGGCMAVTCAVEFATPTLPPSVIKAISEAVDQSSISLIRQRLVHELKQRNIPESSLVEQLADYFASLMSGMAVMAKVGISQARMFGIIEQSLLVLPKAGKKKLMPDAITRTV